MRATRLRPNPDACWNAAWFAVSAGSLAWMVKPARFYFGSGDAASAVCVLVMLVAGVALCAAGWLLRRHVNSHAAMHALFLYVALAGGLTLALSHWHELPADLDADIRHGLVALPCLMALFWLRDRRCEHCSGWMRSSG